MDSHSKVIYNRKPENTENGQKSYFFRSKVLKCMNNWWKLIECKDLFKDMNWHVWNNFFSIDICGINMMQVKKINLYIYLAKNVAIQLQSWEFRRWCSIFDSSVRNVIMKYAPKSAKSSKIKTKHRILYVQSSLRMKQNS